MGLFGEIHWRLNGLVGGKTHSIWQCVLCWILVENNRKVWRKFGLYIVYYIVYYYTRVVFFFLLIRCERMRIYVQTSRVNTRIEKRLICYGCTKSKNATYTIRLHNIIWRCNGYVCLYTVSIRKPSTADNYLMRRKQFSRSFKKFWMKKKK